MSMNYNIYMLFNIIFDQENIKARNKARQLLGLLTNWKLNQEKFDYLFIIGGDGNFLKYSQPFLESNVKIIFINAGTLGFYSYITDMSDFDIQDIMNEDNYKNLDLIHIKSNDYEWKAINDFSVYSNYAINYDIYINDIFLQSVKGNGILVSTPMGSTARNKSLGGPIVLPELHALILTEIEPIHNRHYNSLFNPLVINNNNTIKIIASKYKQYHLIIDGRVIDANNEQEHISIKHIKSKAKFLIKSDSKNWINKINYAFGNEN